MLLRMRVGLRYAGAQLYNWLVLFICSRHLYKVKLLLRHPKAKALVLSFACLLAQHSASHWHATDVLPFTSLPKEGGKWGVWGEGGEASGSPHSFTAKMDLWHRGP